MVYPCFDKPKKFINYNRLPIGKLENGAQEKTRTSTPLRVLAPEASASTNSATWARLAGLGKRAAIVNYQSIIQLGLHMADALFYVRHSA